MQEISIMEPNGSDIFKSPQITIGLDLGDRSSRYCVLNAAGDIILERKLATTPGPSQKHSAAGRMGFEY